MMRALAAVATVLLGCDGGTARRDAGTPRPADARVGADGGPGVACLGAACAPGMVCCREVIIPGEASTYCVDEVPHCGGATFECDGPEDCDGGICCADDQGWVSCAATCTGLTACHTDQDCAGAGCCDTPHGVIATCCGSRSSGSSAR
ncbi:MAG TPA: hypothetical protein VML75_23605 [Kofleriaceae bacterium]|nr:hypothetical protein [Kofleriaceae bacterium]